MSRKSTLKAVPFESASEAAAAAQQAINKGLDHRSVYVGTETRESQVKPWLIESYYVEVRGVRYNSAAALLSLVSSSLRSGAG